MSSVVMPGLPLSQLSIQRHAAPADIAAETGWIMGEIVDGLTTAPEQLREWFQQKFLPGSQKVKANAAGELHVWLPQRLMLYTGRIARALNPEHAQIIHQDGWSKSDVQRYLYEQPGIRVSYWRGVVLRRFVLTPSTLWRIFR
jgi:hypothetical protein